MDDTSEILSGVNMLKDIAHQIAADVGIKLSNVQFDDGRPLGCRDVHLLSITARGKTADTKINHEEVDNHPGREGLELTRAKVRGAVERLKLMIEK